MRTAKLIQLLGFLFVFLSFSASGFAEQTIRITNGEWPPYLSEHLKYHGVVSRIVSDAFALEGITVEYGFFPWARAIKLARMGKWDGTAVWSYTEDRAKDFYYSEPVIGSQWVFFHLKTTDFDWKTIEDLKKYKIGGTLEYEYSKTFEDAEKAGKLDIYRVPTDEQNFEKLLKGRIDIFPQEMEVGYEMIHNIFPKEKAALITHHSLPLKDSPFHLLLSKKSEKNKDMVVLFNRGLKRLQESGKIKQYMTESRQGEYKKK